MIQFKPFVEKNTAIVPNALFVPNDFQENSTIFKKSEWYYFGSNIGKLIGTVGPNGEDTPNSYPLDRFVNYLSNSIGSIAQSIKNASFFDLYKRSSNDLNENAVIFETPELALAEKKEVTKDSSSASSSSTQSVGSYLFMQDIEIDREISNLYAKLKPEITKAYDEAIANKKPLLIIIGENHGSIDSAIIEILVKKIYSDLAIVDKIFTEALPYSFYVDGNIKKCNELNDPSDDKNINACIKNLKIHIPSIYFLETEAKKDNIELTPIDLARCEEYKKMGYEAEVCGETNTYKQAKKRKDDLDDKQFMMDRNAVMAEVILKNTFKNAIAVVGSGHLFGLSEETELKKHFHLLLIDAGYNNYPTISACHYRDKLAENWDKGYHYSCANFVCESGILSLGMENYIYSKDIHQNRDAFDNEDIFDIDIAYEKTLELIDHIYERERTIEMNKLQGNELYGGNSYTPELSNAKQKKESSISVAVIKSGSDVNEKNFKAVPMN